MSEDHRGTEPAPPGGQDSVGAARWVECGLRLLVRDGIDRVKVQVLARELGASRSSFYWCFRDLADLHRQMLDRWLDKNTMPIIQQARLPAPTLSQAILNVFVCWGDPSMFDPLLDVAVRLWARRDPAVMDVILVADEQRMQALTEMFARFGFTGNDALVRARILYFTQIGQYTLAIDEEMERRLPLAAAYVRGFGGVDPRPEEIDSFEEKIRRVGALAPASAR